MFVALLLASSTPIVANGVTFTCTPTRVWDGDGPLWCAEGPKVRLSGIAAREMDGSCRSSQPCPAATAEAARDALARLVGRPIGRSEQGHILVQGPPLRCQSLGNGKGERTAAWCATAKGQDLSCAMVATGTVLRWDRYWGGHRCPSMRRP